MLSKCQLAEKNRFTNCFGFIFCKFKPFLTYYTGFTRFIRNNLLKQC